MVKKRIIPTQLLIDGRLVKTTQFGTYRDVGDPVKSSRVYSDQDADELIFLNINRDHRSVQPLISLLHRVSEVVFMPLAVGGGISSLADAELLIKNGADKVVVNSVAYHRIEVLVQIAEKFGRQALVVSIDVRFDSAHGIYLLFSDCGRQPEPIGLEEHVAKVIAHGAGELLICSIDRDGMMNGYDIPLMKRMAIYSPVPVIACGGAGNYTHMKDAFLETGVDALACSSIFNFGDNNPLRAKAFLSNYGITPKCI
jgi:cyclase